VRVLVVDDEPSIRLALRRFFVREGWEVEEADDGRVALDKLVPANGPAPHFDAIICDLRMPGCTGPELYERLKVSQPERLSHMILATGDSVSAEVAEFVRRPPRDRGPSPALAQLTEREVGVLRLVARGLPNHEIAATLSVSDATVKTHVNHILGKLDLRDRTQAVVFAYESGLVEPGLE